MSMIRNVQDFFSTHQETSENHRDPQLRSHYYKSTPKKALATVQDIIKQIPGYTITSVSEDRGEISVNITKPQKAFMVITVISIRPFETAVDFSVTTDRLLPASFGLSKKVIISLYKRLDNTNELIGTGINSDK